MQWLCRLYVEQRDTLIDILARRFDDEMYIASVKDTLDLVEFRMALHTCLKNGTIDNVKHLAL